MKKMGFQSRASSPCSLPPALILNNLQPLCALREKGLLPSKCLHRRQRNPLNPRLLTNRSRLNQPPTRAGGKRSTGNAPLLEERFSRTHHSPKPAVASPLQTKKQGTVRSPADPTSRIGSFTEWVCRCPSFHSAAHRPAVGLRWATLHTKALPTPPVRR